MQNLAILLAVVFCIATVTPLIAKYIHMPTIVVEIIAGIILGQSFLNLIPDHAALDFFVTIGIVYIMFLAGFKIELAEIQRHLGKTIVVALFSFLVPFYAGWWLAMQINGPTILIAIMFCTTSLGLILPLCEELSYKKHFVYILLGSVLLVDLVSIFVLSFSLPLLNQDYSLSFIYSVSFVVGILLITRLAHTTFLQRVLKYIERNGHGFAMSVRLSFALIAGITFVAQLFGLHIVFGAFIAGLIMAGLTNREPEVESKLENFGYGFFIPLFFILVGAQIDLPSLLTSLTNIKILSLVLVIGLMSKIAGTAVAARLTGFNWQESTSMGLFHATRMGLIIAIAKTGEELGLLNEVLFSAFMVLAVASAILCPSVGKWVLRNRRLRKLGMHHT